MRSIVICNVGDAASIMTSPEEWYLLTKRSVINISLLTFINKYLLTSAAVVVLINHVATAVHID